MTDLFRLLVDSLMAEPPSPERPPRCRRARTSPHRPDPARVELVLHLAGLQIAEVLRLEQVVERSVGDRALALRPGRSPSPRRRRGPSPGNRCSRLVGCAFMGIPARAPLWPASHEPAVVGTCRSRRTWCSPRSTRRCPGGPARTSRRCPRRASRRGTSAPGRPPSSTPWIDLVRSVTRTTTRPRAFVGTSRRRTATRCRGPWRERVVDGRAVRGRVGGRGLAAAPCRCRQRTDGHSGRGSRQQRAAQERARAAGFGWVALWLMSRVPADR